MKIQIVHRSSFIQTTAECQKGNIINISETRDVYELMNKLMSSWLRSRGCLKSEGITKTFQANKQYSSSKST